MLIDVMGMVTNFTYQIHTCYLKNKLRITIEMQYPTALMSQEET